MQTDGNNYGQSGAGNFFSLQNDKDSAKVRILYGTAEDVEGYAVYRVKVGDKDRYVNSLRAYNEPIEKDPFAMAGYKCIARLFIPVYNLETNEVQLWERSKSYFTRIESMAARYNPLYNEIIEIERNGAKGDKNTEYQFYPIENSEFDINSIEIPNPIGTVVLDKTFEEMQYYVEHGCFPDDAPSVPHRNYSEPTRRTPDNAGVQRRVF